MQCYSASLSDLSYTAKGRAPYRATAPKPTPAQIFQAKASTAIGELAVPYIFVTTQPVITTFPQFEVQYISFNCSYQSQCQPTIHSLSLIMKMDVPFPLGSLAPHLGHFFALRLSLFVAYQI